MGAEVAAQDVAEATGGDHGGERAADGREDEDLAAVLEPPGYGVVDPLPAHVHPADDHGADESDEQGDDGVGEEGEHAVVPARGLRDGPRGDQQQGQQERGEAEQQVGPADGGLRPLRVRPGAVGAVGADERGRGRPGR